jgi:hypothetical protein
LRKGAYGQKEKKTIEMQNDAEPGQLMRSAHIENLEFTPDEEEEEDPGAFVSLLL